jgi:hypothetical protein
MYYCPSQKVGVLYSRSQKVGVRIYPALAEITPMAYVDVSLLYVIYRLSGCCTL